MSVKIVVESSSDIDSVEASKLGIIMIPIPVSFGEEEYYDGVNLSREEFYDKLAQSPSLPKTSMINSYKFKEVFEEIVGNGDEVVAIMLSSKLSGTYNSAKKASEGLEDKVYVVDSLSATAGIKLLAEHALHLIASGKSAKEIFKILEDKKNKLQIYAMIDTLKYLKKGGRVSPLVAFAGELIGIKPMIAVLNGKVEIVGKVVGVRKAVTYLNAEVEKIGGIDFDMPFYMLYSGKDQTTIDKYISDNSQMWQCGIKNVKKLCIGATIGTHVGPGGIGIAFFSK